MYQSDILVLIFVLLSSNVGWGQNAIPNSEELIATNKEKVATTSPSPIVIDLKTSRFKGVAPLTVFFDASTTIHQNSNINAFHDLTYQWNFGDINAGYWDFKPISRNTATGPITTHVFDSIGVHVVELEVKDKDGNKAIKTVIVRVEKPRDIYAEEQTICFSTTGEFFDAPHEAKKVQIKNLADVEPYVNSCTRLLFRRGDTIRSSIGLYIEKVKNLTIGAYGPCLSMDNRGICKNAPVIVIDDIGENAFNISSCDSNRIASDIRIMDLNIINQAEELLGNGIYCGAYTKQNLFYRLKISGFAYAILYDPLVFGHWDSLGQFTDNMFDEITIAQCILENGRTIGRDIVKISGERIAILGSDLIGKASGHLINGMWLEKGVFLHNRLFKPALNRHCLFIGTQELDILPTENQLIINDNYFEGNEGMKQLVSLEHTIDNGIFNRNYLYTGKSRTLIEGVRVKANHFSLKNNIVNASYGSQKKFTGIRVGEQSRVEVTNNTFYKSDTTKLFTGILLSPNVEQATILNNLVYAPKAKNLKVLTGRRKRTVAQSNLVPSVHPFIAKKLERPLDFQLDSNSLVVGKGVPHSSMYKDYLGNLRPNKKTIDIGAFQFTLTPITKLTPFVLESSPIRNFPKRSRSYFAIDLSKITSTYDVEIFDYRGEIVFYEYGLNNLFYIWETANYEAGVYWIKVSSKEATFSHKVWINR